MQRKRAEELDRRRDKKIEEIESRIAVEDRPNEKEPKRQKNGLLSVVSEMNTFLPYKLSDFIIKHIFHECTRLKFLPCLAIFCTSIFLSNFTPENMSNAIDFDDPRKALLLVLFSYYSYQDSFPTLASVWLDFEYI